MRARQWSGRRRRRSRHAAAATGCALALLAAAAGCSRGFQGPQMGTADLRLGDREVVLDLAGCVLDQATVYVAGRGEGITLQAVTDLEPGPPGERKARPAATAVTVDAQGHPTRGAAGPEAHERMGEGPPAPGRITSVRVDGSRVRISADLVELDDQRRSTGRPAGTLDLDANCPSGAASDSA